MLGVVKIAEKPACLKCSPTVNAHHLTAFSRCSRRPSCRSCDDHEYRSEHARLNNAATPLGLKAMEELNKLNPKLGTATNAMCTFLVINTAD